jgi:small conductance mechanosensitive channel
MKETLIKWSELILPWLLTHGLKIVIILVIAYVAKITLSRIIRRAVTLAVVSEDGIAAEEAEKKREETLIRIFNGALAVILITITLLMVLQEVGVEIAPLLAGAGIIGLAFGFGGQYLIRDLISGLFLILENQYRIGDVVNINSTGGLVEDISLRMTTLRDLDGTVHHIPHGEITMVSNLSKSFARVNIDVGVSYSCDIEHVIKVVNRVGLELSEDFDFKDSIITPPKFLRVNEFADSAIIIKILGDTKPLKQWEISGEFRKRLKKAFDKEGIEIPFNQVVVHSAK